MNINSISCKIVVALITVLLLNSCFEKTGITDTAQEFGKTNVSVSIGRIGMIRNEPINLKELVITLESSEVGASITDTFPLSGTDAHTILAQFDSLAAPYEWTVTVTSTDENDSVIHAGTEVITVQPYEVTDVHLELASQVSMLKAAFNSLPDSINKCELIIDDTITLYDSFPVQSKVGDSVVLAYNYVNAIPFGSQQSARHTIVMNAYGSLYGTQELLYSATRTIYIFSGKDYSQKNLLPYVGPTEFQGSAEMSVNLGKVGDYYLDGSFEDTLSVDTLFYEDFATEKHWLEPATKQDENVGPYGTYDLSSGYLHIVRKEDTTEKAGYYSNGIAKLIDLPLYADSYLSFDVMPLYTDFPEFHHQPIMVYLTLVLSSGERKNVTFLYTYTDNIIEPQESVNSKHFFYTVPQGEWTTVTHNLSEIYPDISKIGILRITGGGWNYEGAVDNVLIYQD